MTGLKLLADRVDAKLLSHARRGAAVVTFAAPACQDLASARIV